MKTASTFKFHPKQIIKLNYLLSIYLRFFLLTLQITNLITTYTTYVYNVG